jgi:hypothetical protein
MKKRLPILCLTLLIAINSKAQQRTTKAQEPPKKASKIIVLVKDSANTLLNRISAELFDKGYTIDSKDENAKYIVTRERPSNKYGTMSRIRTRINDTAIVFTSQIALNSDRDIFGTKEAAKTFYDVDFSGSKKSAMREAWLELEEIARKFGDNIVYSK